MHRNPTSLISKNISVLKRRTSIRLEAEMWKALAEIAAYEGCSIHDICSLIAIRKRKDCSLTSSVRIFLILYFKAAATEEGHKRAGHGAFEKMQQRARLCTNEMLDHQYIAGESSIEAA